MKLRTSVYIAKIIADCSPKHVFMVTGGGAMFLNDAFGHQPNITPVYCHHEQACAMAAEAHARISGEIGIINVTTGPGGINALNGVFGAWTDSLPMLVISGQVKRETCLGSYDLPTLRQLGDQEADIIAMVKPVTKYAVQINDPAEIRYHLEKAIYLATNGRPGPCWLDIPIDVQSSIVNPETLRSFEPSELDLTLPDTITLNTHCNHLLDRLVKAKRPVILAGSGIRLGNALEEFNTIIRQLGIPVVTAWTHDLIASDDPLFCGRAGTIGTRAGNFTVQNADLLIILGSRMNIRQTSYNWQSLAPQAFKIQVDIDPAELDKPTFRPDLAITCDVKPLLAHLAAQILEFGFNTESHTSWLEWCKKQVADYPAVQKHQKIFTGKINPYFFVDRLISQLNKDDIIACGNASACIIPFQTAQLKFGQRLFSNSGSASMGYDLPAAIGAYYGALAARGEQQRVICIAGDGSIMMNIQELQTIMHYQLPIKIFVIDNGGYLSIRTSQNNFFKRLTGEGPSSGVSFPDFSMLAKSFGIPSCKLDGADFETLIPDIIDSPGPYLCHVMVDETQQFEPRMSSRQTEDGSIVTPPLEDMFPFLDREELARNMLDQ